MTQLLPSTTEFVSELAPSTQLYASVVPGDYATANWDIISEAGSMGDQDGCATFCPYSASPAERKMGWAAFNEIQQADGSARITPKLNLVSGTIGRDSLGDVGVFARMTGGFWLESGDADGHWWLPSGYFFVHSRRPGVADRLFVARIVSGVWFQIWTKVLEPVGADPLVYPGPMRIECEGNVVRCFRSNTRLVADFDDIPVGIGVDPNPPDDADLVFSFTDNHATAILGAGRWGFGVMQPLDEGGSQFGSCIKEFRIQDAAGETILRDKFQRAYPRASRELTDSLGRVGRSIQQTMTGDYHGEQSNPAAFRSLIGELSDRVSLGRPVNINGIDQGFGWHIGQRAADSDDQSRELTFHLANYSPEKQRRVGVLLRGTWSGTPQLEWDGSSTGREGYMAEAYWEQGAATDWQVRIIDMHGSSLGPQVIASAPLPGLGLGSDHTFEFSVEGSPAKMRVVFNGTALSNWTVPSLLAGVSAFGEFVTDGRTAHHATGSLQGTFFHSSATDPLPLVWFHQWAEGAPVGIATGEDPSTYATIPIPLEGDNSSGELFDCDQGWPASVEHRRPIVVKPTRSGHKFKHPAGSRFRRYWPLSLVGRTPEKIAYIADFLSRHKGSEIPFRWVESQHGQEVLARFSGDSWTEIRKTHGGQAATLELEEVFIHG